MLAEYAFNPFTKFSTFKEGKNMIEKAIAQDPKNAEIRVLRLGVQLNAPSFLLYHSNIDADVELITNALISQDFQQSPTFQKNVTLYLLNHAPLTEQQFDQISALKKWLRK